MDFVELIRIPTPSLETVQRQIALIPPRLFDQVRILQLSLYFGYLKNDFYSEFQKYDDVFELFPYLFGPDYLKKVQGLPILPQKDVELLSNAEVLLEKFYEERVIKRGFRKAMERPRMIDLRLTDKWEEVRKTTGKWGYRQIAKKLREFLELGEISISPEERREMQLIFRMGDKIDKSNDAYKRLIFVEFQFGLRKADWQRLYDLDPNSKIYEIVFDASPEIVDAQLVRNWCVRRVTFPEDKRLIEAHNRVEDLKELILRRPLTTAQYWQMNEILQGNWKQAVERATGQRCEVCQELARYECIECDTLLCDKCRE